MSGCIAKGAKDAVDAKNGADAVGGTGGDVSATGRNVPVPPGMSWAPRRCLGCQASSLFLWAARQGGGGEMQKLFLPPCHLLMLQGLQQAKFQVSVKPKQIKKLTRIRTI